MIDKTNPLLASTGLVLTLACTSFAASALSSLVAPALMQMAGLLMSGYAGLPTHFIH